MSNPRHRPTPAGGPLFDIADRTSGIGRTAGFWAGPPKTPRLGWKCGHPRAQPPKRSHHPCPHAPTTSVPMPSRTSRSPSATTPRPGCARSSRCYSTALGPGLGGTRFYPYATEDDALADVLNLSRGDGLQERGRRAGPRRRQGGHHRRPATGQDAGAAAGVRPVRARASAGGTSRRPTSAPTSPTWTSVAGDDAVRDRAVRRRTAGPATRRSSPRTACSRACGRPPPSGGGRRRWPAGGWGSRGRQGRPTAGRAAQADGASVVVVRREPRRRGRGAGRVPVGRGGRRRATTLTGAPARRLLAERHGRRARRRHGRAAAGGDRVRGGEQPARVEARAGRRTGWRSTGSSTRRTSASTAAGSSRWPTSCKGFDFERARARTAGIFDTTLAVLREASARGVTTGRGGRPARRGADRRRVAGRRVAAAVSR